MATCTDKKHLLITGPPGIGKTTLVTKIAKTLVAKGLKVAGFYTEEVREKGRRIGFDIVSLDNSRAILARNNSSMHSDFCVGKYKVDVASFESAALGLLKDKQSSIMVIDEIGKMELMSKPFEASVRGIFCDGKISVVATVPIGRAKSLPLVDELKRRRDVYLVEVNIIASRNVITEMVAPSNRNDLVESLVLFLERSVKLVAE